MDPRYMDNLEKNTFKLCTPTMKKGLNPTELRIGIDLVASLGERGVTVLLVEHVMDAVRALCGRCVVMNAGKTIADGRTAEVLADAEVVRAYLGAEHA